MALESHASELPVPLGSVIAGKYRIDNVLGVGGMGVVTVGRHLQLDQKIAIKVLRPAALADREMVARFGREARAASQIKSEHVARVIDVGELAGGVPYMVMEYLEGMDLGKVVKKRGRLPPREAVDYVLQACEALAEAHRAGIVHRDLKPANLFLTRRPDSTPLVKVLDFGISKLRQSALDNEELTQSEIIMGSPHYMSPEQMRTPKTVDSRADIWALGAILYKLVTGDTPFRGGTTAELCVQLLTQTAPRMSARIADVPPALDDAVARCMTTDLASRYATIAQLAEALQSVASEEGNTSIRAIIRVMNAERSPSSAPPARAGTGAAYDATVAAGSARRVGPTADADSLHASFGGSSYAPIRSGNRRLWAMIGMVGIVVAGAAGFGAWRMVNHHDLASRPAETGLVAAPPPVAAVPPLPPPEELPGTAAPVAEAIPTAATSASVKSSTTSLPPAPRGPRPPTTVAAAKREPAPPPAVSVSPPPRPPGDLGFGNRK